MTNVPEMKKPLQPLEQLRMELHGIMPKIKSALPAHITPEKFSSVVMTAIQNNPDLLGLDRASLFNAAMKCAQDGLLPDGREAAFVKFGNKVTYMPMVAGILKKVRNSGELANINSQVVYTNDEFEYLIDETGEHLRHRPKLDGERGDRRMTYAVARTKDGAIYLEVMTEQQIQDVRNVSRSKDSGPWSGPFADEMRKKTAIRRLSKRLPMSTDLTQTIERDDEMYDVKSTNKAADLTAQLQAQTLALPKEIEGTWENEVTAIVEDPKKV